VIAKNKAGKIDYVSYAKKYMEILHSLKFGGYFYYAPDLPFIEQFLDDKEFQINNFEIENLEYESTIIKRKNPFGMI